MTTSHDDFKLDGLTAWLAVLRERLRQGDRPEMVSGFGKTRAISYLRDEENDDAEYAFVAFELSSDFLAEIEYGTFGHLQGFRIYLD